MIALLGFVLECAAIAAMLGIATSALVLVVTLAARPLLRGASPGLRADSTFVAAMLPAVVAVAGTAAAALPALESALGFVPDHCLQHDHHLHVCIIHRTALRPELAALGALSLAVFAVRMGSLLANHFGAARRIRDLERLGTVQEQRFLIALLPGAPRLCHAVGAFRRRVLLSQSLATQIHPDELRCALAHEGAHLSRRDPLANLVMSIAGPFAAPFWTGALLRRYRAAAEQACDDIAARAVGDAGLVAQALVAVTRLQRDAAVGREALAAFGFGGQPLEVRVQRLLAGGSLDRWRACALPTAAVLAACTFGIALQQAPAIHHAVETLLHLLF